MRSNGKTQWGAHQNEAHAGVCEMRVRILPKNSWETDGSNETFKYVQY